MAEIIISIASAVVGALVAPIGRRVGHLVAPIGCHVGYLFNYHGNVGNLKTEVDKLRDVRDKVERSVVPATQDVQEHSVEEWLKTMNEITEKAGKVLLDGEDNAKKRCFNGLCPNLKLRYQLSKKAKKTIEKVAVIIEDGEKFSSVPCDSPPPGVGSTSIKDYEAFESRASTLKDIMEALRDPAINMIGVCGMGGVGKTMLVKEAARKAKKDKLFDKAVMAVVSQTPNIKKIQEEIAAPLGLRFHANDTDFERVHKLCKRLQEKESILIILDDVWAQLDLEALGIPLEDIQKGLKIVVTSRRLDLLSNQMNIENNFKIEALDKDEAWNLFKKKADNSVENPVLKPTALKVAEECAGLPIALVVVASALKRKELKIWRNALNKLKSAAPTTIEGMNAKVYSSLKWSYDFLEDDDAKKLFLLCCLFPEDYQFSIRELLKYGKGVSLFRGIETLEEARDNVYALVDQLKSSCLLLDGDTSGLFRMHDVVRDVGISVAFKEKKMLTGRNSVELEEWMAEEKLRFCSALSLPYSNVHELPTCVESPELKFLLFFSNSYSKIPDTFFKGMKQLKVLTLRKVSFSLLHSSLQFVSSLQTLCLDECNLQDISIIGELKELKILSFKRCHIRELPREIKKLTCLKLLDLTDCNGLQVIPSNVIASLCQLEELYMPSTFAKWEVDGNASLAELKDLSRLVTLDIRIQDVNIIPNDLVFEKLIRYTISAFPGLWWFIRDREVSRVLVVKVNVEKSIQLLFGIKMLLKRTEYLELDGINGFKSIVYELDGEGFHDLKYLDVKRNSDLEYVINKTTQDPLIAFPKLERLVLLNLINLKEICRGQPPADSFSNLRSVKVLFCDRLQNLFSLSVARRLSKLQEIEILNCKNMDEIVAEGREAAEDNNEAMREILFRQLRCLTLRRLPELRCFRSKVKAVPCLNDPSKTDDAGSNEIITEGEHSISVPLFNEKVAFPNLEELKLFDLPRLTAIWKKDSQGIFQGMVGEIVGNERVEEEAMDKILFSRLTHLSLCGLPLLNSFYQGIHISEWPSLKNLYLKDCENVEILVLELSSLKERHGKSHLNTLTEKPFFLVHQVAFPNLEKLELFDLPRLTAIWKKDSQGIFQGMVGEIVGNERVEEEAMDKILFSRLTHLSLCGLPLLNSFYPGIHISEWPSLKNLYLKDCENVEILVLELCSLKERHGKSHLNTLTEKPFFLVHQVTFPNLEELELDNLPRLTAVWAKDCKGSLSFLELTSLSIRDCESLIYIFTTSTAKNLVQLQDRVEEVIIKEGVEEEEAATTDKIMFPKVKHLTLKSLKQLKSFCQWIHISEWPSLKVLRISDCHNVEIIAVELSSFKETRGKANLDTSAKQHLFLVEKVAFPNLEEMRFEKMSSMVEIWQGQFHAPSFCKLKVLKVKECNKMLKVFPISLLQNLQNLKELCVESCSSLEEVFELEGRAGEIGYASTFPPLQKLELIELPKLMHLWKEDSQLSEVFQNLKTLRVISCGSLTHLFPSTITNGLVQIESITIASEEGEATFGGTIFSQLYYLELRDLPNLTSFCQGSNNLSFPCLGEVCVVECPELKTFSSNILCTPMLKLVQVKKDEWIWDGDLKTIIQQRFEQKNADVSEEDSSQPRYMEA